MNRTRRLLLLACSLAFLSFNSWSATYYVSPTGNDTATGSSVAPFKTIQYAVNRIKGGDTLIVRAGTYLESNGVLIDYSLNGTAQQYTTIQAEGEVFVNAGTGKGAAFLIKGDYTKKVECIKLDGFKILNITSGSPYSSPKHSGIVLEYANNCIVTRNVCGANISSGGASGSVAGISVVYSTNCTISVNNCSGLGAYAREVYGIYVEGGDHNKITANQCNNNWATEWAKPVFGIAVNSSSYNLIEGNSCNDNDSGGQGAGNYGWSWGIQIGGTGNIIKRNTVTNRFCNSYGIVASGSNTEITENYISTQFNIDIGSGCGVKILRNIIFGKWSGFTESWYTYNIGQCINAYVPDNSKLENLTIANNVFIVSSNSYYPIYLRCSSGSNSRILKNTQIYNNIFFGTGTNSNALVCWDNSITLENVSVDHNSYSRNLTDPGRLTTGANNLAIDNPAFRNQSMGNYQLLASSPCLAAGRNGTALGIFGGEGAPLDQDRDGMPDDWERLYGTRTDLADDTLDLDRDSILNFSEFLNRTDIGFNRPPVLLPIQNQTVKIRDTVTLNPTCYDLDNLNNVTGDDNVLTVKYSGWMTAAKKRAVPKDVGTHQVTVTVLEDGKDVGVSQTINITVQPFIDADQNGFEDTWEEHYGYKNNPAAASADDDLDGLTNLQEFLNDTNPTLKDTDGDGMEDRWEVECGLDPCDPSGDNGPTGDRDDDRLTNLEEFKLGTRADKPDTDGDGLTDYEEVTPPPSNLALNATATINGQTKEQTAPQYAVLIDGDESCSRYLSVANNGYLLVDLGKICPINQIRLKVYDGVTGRFYKYTIAVSNTPTTGPWITLADRTSTPKQGWDEISLTNSPSYQYILISARGCTDANANNNLHLLELQIKGTGSDNSKLTSPTNPDSDGDEMWDGWEKNHGLDPMDNQGVNGANGDLDNDTFTNMEEYLGQSDPNSPASLPTNSIKINSKSPATDAQTIKELEQIGFSVDAKDTQDKTIQYEWFLDGKPQPVDPTFPWMWTWTPTDTDSGNGLSMNHEVKCKCSSKTGHGEATWNVTVNNKNQLPTLLIPDQTLECWEMLKLNPVYSDPDNNNGKDFTGDDNVLTVKYTGYEEWMKSVEQRDIAHCAGTYPIKVTVLEDGKDVGVFQTVNVTFRSMVDSDHDGMDDKWEANYYGINHNLSSDGANDNDGDDLKNIDEFNHGSDPTLKDTDGDGMEDAGEVKSETCAYVPDADKDYDGDKLINRLEYEHQSNARKTDTDMDGISDYDEVVTYGTNPALSDTDGDGLSDKDEISSSVSKTDYKDLASFLPNVKATNSEHTTPQFSILTDGDESCSKYLTVIANGYLQVDLGAAYPIDRIKLHVYDAVTTRGYKYIVSGSTDQKNWVTLADRTSSPRNGSDEISMPSFPSYQYILISARGCTDSSANNHLHLLELEIWGNVITQKPGTSPTNPDSDGDGMWDGWEKENGLDPSDNKGINGADGDINYNGVTNLQEYLRHIEFKEITPASTAWNLEGSYGSYYTTFSFTAQDQLKTNLTYTWYCNGQIISNAKTNSLKYSYDLAKTTTYAIKCIIQSDLGVTAEQKWNFTVVDNIAKTDSDLDGLPDQWETKYGLNPSSSQGDDGASGDPDHDDYTNIEEFIGNSDPKDRASIPPPAIIMGGCVPSASTQSIEESQYVAFSVEAYASQSNSLSYRWYVDDTPVASGSLTYSYPKTRYTFTTSSASSGNGPEKTYEVKCKVENLPSVKEVKWLVTVRQKNYPPYFKSDTITVSPLKEINLETLFSDPDNEYSGSENTCPWDDNILTATYSGWMTGPTKTPQLSDIGKTFQVTVKVQDNGTPPLSCTKTIKIIVSDDVDNDGMSDQWEAANGLNTAINDANDNLDGDGYTNLEECVGGSNPRDINSTPEPKVTNISFTNNCPTLEWKTPAAGKKYTILRYSGPLKDDVYQQDLCDWDFAVEGLVSDASGKMTWTDTACPLTKATAGQILYRHYIIGLVDDYTEVQLLTDVVGVTQRGKVVGAPYEANSIPYENLDKNAPCHDMWTSRNFNDNAFKPNDVIYAGWNNITGSWGYTTKFTSIKQVVGWHFRTRGVFWVPIMPPYSQIEAGAGFLTNQNTPPVAGEEFRWTGRVGSKDREYIFNKGYNLFSVPFPKEIKVNDAFSQNAPEGYRPFLASNATYGDTIQYDWNGSGFMRYTVYWNGPKGPGWYERKGPLPIYPSELVLKPGQIYLYQVYKDNPGFTWKVTAPKCELEE